jgi:hypothetical protein
MLKSRRTRCARHAPHMRKEILVSFWWKSQKEIDYYEALDVWHHNIKMYFREIGRGCSLLD